MAEEGSEELSALPHAHLSTKSSGSLLRWNLMVCIQSELDKEVWWVLGVRKAQFEASFDMRERKPATTSLSALSRMHCSLALAILREMRLCSLKRFVSTPL